MRVLLVHDYGTATGGAENMVLLLRDRLRARGHEVCLFTSTARPLDVPVLADETCLGTTSGFRTLLQSANPWAARRLGALVRSFRPDVVFVRMLLTQLSPLILPALRAVPAVYNVADYRPICPTGTRWLPRGGPCHHRVGVACAREGCVPLRDWPPLMAQMALWGRWRRVFDRVVVASEWMRERLGAEGLVADAVVPNGVPPRPARAPLDGPPAVAFAGRLVPAKGLDVLLAAMARVRDEIPDARLLVAGDGPARADLERAAQQAGLGDAVTWLGHVGRDALEAALAPAWVHAVPSVWDEPFGIVAAEALMRGTAAVVSRSGGLAEIVEDGVTGRTVPPSDVAALAAALRDTLGDRECAERLGHAGRARALATYSDDVYVDRMLDQMRRARVTRAARAPLTR